MPYRQDFVDYYSVLGTPPDSDAKTLERAYRKLAQEHHPDHTGDDDIEEFQKVNDAYAVLRNPEARVEYDKVYAVEVGFPRKPTRPDESSRLDETEALKDADAHDRILLLLYKKRRENAREAGVMGFYVQQMLGCSDEALDFHLWYLRQKGYVEVTEQGDVAITIAGVDHVIAMSRAAEAEQLLISQRLPRS